MIKLNSFFFYKLWTTMFLISIVGCKPSTIPTSIPEQTDEIDPYSFDNYQPNTFENIIDTISQEGLLQNLKNKDLYLETGLKYQFLSVVHGTYAGECQNIPEVRLMMIETWTSGVFGVLPAEVDKQYLYKEQCLFTENSTKYWLPVQNILIPYIQKELSIDNEVSLYILWLGASKIDGVIDYVFLINNIKNQ